MQDVLHFNVIAVGLYPIIPDFLPMKNIVRIHRHGNGQLQNQDKNHKRRNFT